MRATALAIVLLGCGLLGVSEAANFCEHGGKKYSIHATRCENGKQLRCIAANTWKEIGTCK